jgi:SsrA-binding protein
VTCAQGKQFKENALEWKSRLGRVSVSGIGTRCPLVVVESHGRQVGQKIIGGRPAGPVRFYVSRVGPFRRRRADRPIDEEVTATRETGRRLIASNRRARHDYAILRTYEAGLVLIGNEVKSLRAGHASLGDAFVQEEDGELILHGLHIPEHALGRPGTRTLYQPRRTRKLLLHRSEIDKIISKLGDAGVTVVPLSMYFQDGWVKVEIALARGLRTFDKRQAMAQRDADRDIARELSDRVRGRRRRGARGPG